MAKTATYSVETELGCGFMGGILQLRRTYFPRKPYMPSLPASKTYADEPNKARARNSSATKPINKPSAAVHHLRPPVSHRKGQARRPSNAARTSTSSASRVPAELARAITPHHQSNESKALVRATSSNVMLLGQLGNLRQLKAKHFHPSNSPNATIKTVDYLSKNIQDHKYGYGMMGNIVRQSSDAETVKSMGNEAYKKGRFEEALSLYDRAIALDSSKATYRSNRSAALTGLGRLPEAVAECKEATRIDPSYQRAHHRLANLYLRLGEVDKALLHYDQLGSSADPKDIAKAQSMKKHLTRCDEARRYKEWVTLLEETHNLISSGADSAPQVYALQVEALMNLHRHQEAHAVFRKRPNFGTHACTNLFGLAASAYLLMVASQVYLTVGRFEDAIEAAQHAARLDPNSKDASVILKKARAVSSARTSGNLLFKAEKYAEAIALYSQGLEHDQYNSVLLCNRAACRAKLGQFEKAVEDCTTVLTVQPRYTKARLRRADCNAKMGRWEAAIQDYEVLKRESPGDEEVGKALLEARVQQRGEEDAKDMSVSSNLVLVSSNERFRHFVASPGMCVVLFCNKTKQKQALQPMQRVCKRFPSVSFLKVEVEEHPHLAKSEGVSSIPAFKIYKNGSRVMEIPGNSGELLESSIKVYSS